jgi:pimeloyl-ACP methyl ester carboxylesterase
MTSALPTAHDDDTAAPVLSFTPVVVAAPDRAVDLSLRVSAPIEGGELPIILLSHGHGPSNYVSSLYGYGPLADYYAAHGFVVIQPTHLDSATLGLREAVDPEAPLYWRQRARDMSHILDQLDAVESVVPELEGRLDRDKVGVVGHSMGGHTASVLLGLRFKDPGDGSEVDLAEPRVRAGVIMCAPGRGDALSEYAAEHYPVLATTDFSQMTTPALVVAGENDNVEHLTVAGPQWPTDAYTLSPPPKSLLTVFEAEHGLGGVAGYDLAETTDENPANVAMVQVLTSAYLRTQLFPGDPAWQTAVNRMAVNEGALGRIESK